MCVCVERAGWPQHLPPRHPRCARVRLLPARLCVCQGQGRAAPPSAPCRRWSSPRPSSRPSPPRSPGQPSPALPPAATSSPSGRSASTGPRSWDRSDGRAARRRPGGPAAARRASSRAGGAQRRRRSARAAALVAGDQRPYPSLTIHLLWLRPRFSYPVSTSTLTLLHTSTPGGPSKTSSHASGTGRPQQSLMRPCPRSQLLLDISHISDSFGRSAATKSGLQVGGLVVRGGGGGRIVHSRGGPRRAATRSTARLGV